MQCERVEIVRVCPILGHTRMPLSLLTIENVLAALLRRSDLSLLAMYDFSETSQRT